MQIAGNLGKFKCFNDVSPKNGNVKVSNIKNETFKMQRKRN